MNGWVWGNGGVILTGEKWSAGRKTLYSLRGRWMDEYGAMVEWYWQGKTEVQGEKHYTVWVVDEWMCVGQCWNDTVSEICSTRWKKIHSLCGRWVDWFGANVEWSWQGKTEILVEIHYTASVAYEWMCVDQCWNDTDMGDLKYWEKNIIQRGWKMDGWMRSNGGMILRVETEVFGEKY